MKCSRISGHGACKEANVAKSNAKRHLRTTITNRHLDKYCSFEYMPTELPSFDTKLCVATSYLIHPDEMNRLQEVERLAIEAGLIEGE